MWIRKGLFQQEALGLKGLSSVTPKKEHNENEISQGCQETPVHTSMKSASKLQYKSGRWQGFKSCGVGVGLICL